LLGLNESLGEELGEIRITLIIKRGSETFVSNAAGATYLKLEKGL
jgi:hypothetical protein